jgi:hypothetical protein
MYSKTVCLYPRIQFPRLSRRALVVFHSTCQLLMTLQRTAIHPVLFSAICLAVCTFMSGCRLPNRSADNSLASYEHATISYEVAGCCRRILAGESEITPVAYSTDQAATSSVTNESIWKSAQLSIQFPHPDEMADMAQVKLRLSSLAPDDEMPQVSEAGPLAGGVCNDELWVMDIPKVELDQLLIQLSNRGQTAVGHRPVAEAHLNVTVNQQATANTSKREPQLDEFVKRVYQQGRLRGFIPCQQAQQSSPQATPRFPALTQTSFQLDQKL